MGGSKKKQKKYWVDYLMSFHLGFCHGPVDALMGIKMKEKDVFTGEMTGNGFMDVFLPELFGGNEREGGAAGRIHFMNGNEDQLVPQDLASRLGRSVDSTPGFRGLASLFFCGNATTFGPGFLLSANYPSVPTVWARFRRSSKGLDAPNGTIVNDLARYDSNPAHMIWECLTNDEWGMGGLPQQLDRDSFFYAAGVLANEGFCLSMQWTAQSTIEAFIQEILDHIQGLFFFNPRTGLGTLKLLRNDYDPNNLRTIGPQDATVKTFRRKLWGETVNEIVVSWTNPETEEQETVVYQDLANIAMQGAVVSETRNYYGIRYPRLAAKVAARDIVSASTPLATATIEINRKGWDLLPGDVINFAWPKYNVGKIIMRVMEIDYGAPSDSKIRVNLIEDVFGMEHAEYLTPPGSEWEDPTRDPDDPALNLPAKFVALPYSMIQMVIGDAITDEDYPNIFIASLVSPEPDQTDVYSYVLNGEDTLLTGEKIWSSVGEKFTVGKAKLKFPLRQEVTSDVYIEGVTGGMGPEVGGFILIDGGEERDSELALIEADLGDGYWRVWRGVIDTVPHDWVPDTVLWFIGSNFNAWDSNPRLANAATSYKIQPRTSKGIMALDLATVQTTVRPDRPYRPYRPANVKVNLTPFYLSDESEQYGLRHWTIDVTWSNRNRTLEDSIIRKWDEGEVPPEMGQTTEIILTVGNEERRFTDITGTAYSIPVELTGREETFKIKVVSRRDGLESLQGLEVNLRLYAKGYGSDYGYFFGGWPENMEL